MNITLIEVAGASFRTDEQSDALNTEFMCRLGMRKRYLPARLAISRSLSMPSKPEFLGEKFEFGKVIKGDTLFGTGSTFLVWLSLIVEHSCEAELDIKKLIALVAAHWRRGLLLLDKEWDQAEGDVTSFVKRLIDIAELYMTASDSLNLNSENLL